MDIYLKLFISLYWFVLLLNNIRNYKTQPAELKKRNTLIMALILVNTIVLILTWVVMCV